MKDQSWNIGMRLTLSRKVSSSTWSRYVPTVYSLPRRVSSSTWSRYVPTVYSLSCVHLYFVQGLYPLSTLCWEEWVCIHCVIFVEKSEFTYMELVCIHCVVWLLFVQKSEFMSSSTWSPFVFTVYSSELNSWVDMSTIDSLHWYLMMYGARRHVDDIITIFLYA